MTFNRDKQTVSRIVDFRVGMCGAVIVALAGCGSSSSSNGPEGPGQEASTSSSDAMVVSDDGGTVPPGPGAEAGAPIDGSVTTVDGGADTDGATVSTDATLTDGNLADGVVTDSTVAADGGDGGTTDTGTLPEAAVSDSGPVTCASPLGGGPVTTTTTHLDIGVHDPSMTWDGTKYFLFATGGTLDIRSSPDMRTWSNVGNIFTATPAWITTALGAPPGGTTPGSLWAPDISYFNGLFHVYYAGSTFGSNSSVIGLATNTTLETSNKAYAWVDQGLVVQSKTTDNFNAIDPNVSFDQSCAPWLSYGSFWTGIKLHKLDPTTGKLATDDTTQYSIAERPNEGAIEASSIISHNGYFYLFVSFDKCCDGVNSTYRTMAGRSQGSITGPYADSTGLAMLKGGGDQLIATSGRYIGPGGGTAWKDGDTYLYAYHYYDGMDNGNSKLQVRPINFTSDDWITLGDPLFP